MRAVAAAALALLTAAAAPPRAFVERGVAPGGMTTVLMLDADGKAASVTSIAGPRARARARLDTERGYWLRCGSWRAAGDGVTVHQQLVESFRYFPPPERDRWQVRAYRVAGPSGAQRLTTAGKTYAQVATAPLSATFAAGLQRFCKGARDREPTWSAR